MNAILSWVLPPVVGAVIGFITNVIAIKMLFRPLTEKRIFGLRVPFTPGILPKQRHLLSVSIGNMVQRELITPQIIRARLNEADIKENVQTIIKDFISSTLNSIQNNNDMTDKVFTEIVKRLVEFLRKKDIHIKLEAQGKIIVRSAIENMSGLQRLFISAGQYDSTLIENMDKIVDDFINRLEELLGQNDTKNKIIEYLRLHLTATTNSDITNLISALTGEALNFANDKIDFVLKAINIQKVVKDRIDSLEMIKVERIVLDVMSNQFKWIDIFGAFLGGFIGIFQAFLSHALL
jgi:uncharacterized membrane protein YheB (UPF0754 family)